MAYQGQSNSSPLSRGHSSSHRLSTRSSRTLRSFNRKNYRQVTLSECLSSPLALCPSSPVQRQRPPLAPLVFNSDSSHPNRPSTSEHLTCSSPDHSHSFLHAQTSSPPPPPLTQQNSNILRKRPITIDPFFESELSYKQPSHFRSKHRTKFISSLTSNPNTHTIKLWNSEYEHGYEFPFSLSFNHKAKQGEVGAPPAQGELMAVASAMGTISLYHPSEMGAAEDRLPITTLEGIQNGIFALAFSPSDSMLATGSGAQVSEIFDLESGNVIGRLEGHGGTVKTVEFSHHNEQLVVTGSRDGSIKIWDLRTVGTQLNDYGATAHPPVITIQNAHDEKYTGRKRKKGVYLPSVSSVLWSRLADRRLYSAGSANGVVKEWDVRKKSEFNAKKAHPTPADQSIDYQSNYDLVGSMGGEGDNGYFGSDVTTSQRPHGISSLVSTSDGARIYALGTDSRIETHDALYLSRPPCSRLRSYSHPSLIATSLYLKLALAKDDQFLACTSSTGEIYIWDTCDSTVHQESYENDFGSKVDELDGMAKKSSPFSVILFGHRKEVCGIQFWRQGLASCSDDSSVRLWTYHNALLDSR